MNEIFVRWSVELETELFGLLRKYRRREARYSEDILSAMRAEKAFARTAVHQIKLALERHQSPVIDLEIQDRVEAIKLGGTRSSASQISGGTK